MSTQTYYKSNAPEVMAAIKAHEDESAVIRAKGRLFATHFGGELLAQRNIHGYEIAGLAFTPPKLGRLWIFPDRQNAGSQRPRTSIAKATQEEKVELAALKQEWNDRFPTVKADFAPVMAVMGADWGNCVFNGGFGMFQQGGFVYVTTGVKLADSMQEILASEYRAAKDAESKEAAA